MDSTNADLLIIILSVGFIILIIFVCVAIGAMIKILIDVKKITAVGRREAESIAQTMDAIGNKAKKYVTNSLIMDKVIPAIMGAISVSMGAKKMAEEYECKTKSRTKNNKKKGRSRSSIFSEDEVD